MPVLYFPNPNPNKNSPKHNYFLSLLGSTGGWYLSDVMT